MDKKKLNTSLKSVATPTFIDENLINFKLNYDLFYQNQLSQILSLPPLSQIVFISFLLIFLSKFKFIVFYFTLENLDDIKLEKLKILFFM